MNINKTEITEMMMLAEKTGRQNPMLSDIKNIVEKSEDGEMYGISFKFSKQGDVTLDFPNNLKGNMIKSIFEKSVKKYRDHVANR